MAIEATLTFKKCFMLVFIGCFAIFWLVGGILQDISDTIPEETEKSTFPNSPVLDDGIKHLHWFIQVSDIHFSIYYDKKRGPDFETFINEYVNLIGPEAVLVTGDLTDAKTIDLQGSNQFEEEWKQYRKVLDDTKVTEKTVWLDIRGNHDAFDVPSIASKENLYRLYSEQGRTHARSYHYVHEAADGDKFSFINVDACPDPGPKRPFNFFGILYENDLSELKKFRDESRGSTNTIWFGHYPTSIIATPEESSLRDIISPDGIYLCGHLHTLNNFVPAMYAAHKPGNLELELGDWKDNRRFRFFAYDHGLFSFTDETFGESSWPLVLVTNPKHAQFRMPLHEPVERVATSTHIRILAFSPHGIESVRVWIDDVAVTEEVSAVHAPLYTVPWEPMKYNTGMHTLQVVVKDKKGQERIVKQPFTLKNIRLPFAFIPRYILMTNHIALGKTLFSLMMVVCILPLVVLKICRVRVQVSMSGVWGGCLAKFVQMWIRRFYLVAITDKLFYPLTLFALYIAIGPWFVGNMLSTNLGVVFAHGIYLRGVFLRGGLTYIYGFFQLLTFNFPLTLYLGRCVDLSISAHKQQPSRYPLLAWLLDHALFLGLVVWQAYLAYSGFYRAYGSLAFLLCPVRTWSCVLAMYLRGVAMAKTPTAAVVGPEEEEDEQPRRPEREDSRQWSDSGIGSSW